MKAKDRTPKKGDPVKVTLTHAFEDKSYERTFRCKVTHVEHAGKGADKFTRVGFDFTESNDLFDRTGWAIFGGNDSEEDLTHIQWEPKARSWTVKKPFSFGIESLPFEFNENIFSWKRRLFAVKAERGAAVYAVPHASWKHIQTAQAEMLCYVLEGKKIPGFMTKCEDGWYWVTSSEKVYCLSHGDTPEGEYRGMVSASALEGYDLILHMGD